MASLRAAKSSGTAVVYGMKTSPCMKTRFFQIALAIAALGLSSCMRTVTMNSMRPAEITFPSHVKTLLLVDRTKFEKSAVNIIEGVLTGELPGSDRAALESSMSTFQQTLSYTPRFTVIRASETLNGNSITAAFPAPLSWSEIEGLCKRYNADAVVAIELFDSDFIVTDGKRMVKKTVEQNGVKKEIEVPQFYAEGVGNVKMGFRVYDPQGKNIIDQQVFTETNTWEAAGNTARDAIAHLVARNEAVTYVSNAAAADYAYKIAPMPVRITREFYAKKRSAPEIQSGTRMADVNDWEGALDTWKNGASRRSGKNAGKLCYNTAIAYEVFGDLEEAQKWASKAYVEYGNKRARDYRNVLSTRMREEQRVAEQMK